MRDHRPVTPKDLKLLGKKLGVDSGVLEGLDALPPAALEERALAWKREYVDLCIEKQGLPPGLSQEEYENLRSTPHVEFFRRWRELDPPPAYSDAKQRKRKKLGDLSEQGHALMQLLNQARKLTESTFEERFENAGLSDRDRRRALGARVRERLLEDQSHHRIGVFGID